MKESIVFSDEKVGTLSWKLSQELLDVIGEGYPSDLQEAIALELTQQLQGMAYLLSGVLKMGGDAGMHLHHMRTRQMELAQELKAMAQHSLGKGN